MEIDPMPWSYVRRIEGNPFVEWAVGTMAPREVFARGRCRTWKEAQAVCSLNRARLDTYLGRVSDTLDAWR